MMTQFSGKLLPKMAMMSMVNESEWGLTGDNGMMVISTMWIMGNGDLGMAEDLEQHNKEPVITNG